MSTYLLPNSLHKLHPVWLTGSFLKSEGLIYFFYIWDQGVGKVGNIFWRRLGFFLMVEHIGCKTFCFWKNGLGGRHGHRWERGKEFKNLGHAIPELDLGDLDPASLLARPPWVGACLMIVLYITILRRVIFPCVASSECFSTSFFTISWDSSLVPLIMCYKVENVLSNNTWHWGKICPVLLFNNRATDPAWNC